tara:strand:+ start:450 stop:977 length:528 start_codon:yes stop_codon:yes gene_type:complete
MAGTRLGHKIIKNVGRIGKKVMKGVAVGAGIGGALLVGGSYHLGKKEISKAEADRDRIRREAEEDMKRREAEIEAGKRRNAAERAKLLMDRAHQDTFVVSDEGLKQRDPTAVVSRRDDGQLVAAEGPQQDPLDFALAQAERGREAAASFESKKIGGVIPNIKKAIPNPLKKKNNP